MLEDLDAKLLSREAPPKAEHLPEQIESRPKQEELFGTFALSEPNGGVPNESLAGNAAPTILPGPEPENTPASEPEESEAGGLTAWKEALRQNFERWLEAIEEFPADGQEKADEVRSPDLYSFYEQMAVSNTETRKANRRTAEAISQWGDILGRFDGDLGQLRQYFSEISSKPEGLPRATCLVLVEILDRMHRLASAFGSPPRISWWVRDAAWQQAWSAQREGLDILVSHLESFLKTEGVIRVEAAGKPFDPAIMIAVARESNPQYPHHTVMEEVAPGYHHRGELLRPAQVKVTVSAISQTQNVSHP